MKYGVLTNFLQNSSKKDARSLASIKSPTINPLACKNCLNNKEIIEYDIVEDIMDTYDYNEELENYKENIKDVADYLSWFDNSLI